MGATMRKAIAFVVLFPLVLVFSGCAGRTLCHPTKTQEDYRRESYICEEQALLRSAQWGNVGMLLLKQSEKQRCLKERFGWMECNATAQDSRISEGTPPVVAPQQVAPRVYTHTVRQAFGGALSQDQARIVALARAKREVLEQAGTYLESLTEVQQGRLARDEILALAAGVLKAEIVSEKTTAEGQGFLIEITARVEVDPAVLHDRVQKLLVAEEPEEKTSAWYNDKGITLLNSRKYTDAIRNFNEALLINNKNEAAYANRGTAYLGLGKYDAAIKDFNSAIEIYDKYSFAYRNRGAAYAAQKLYDLAIQDFGWAILLNPEDATAYIFRGATNMDRGETEWACRDFKKACELGDCEGQEKASKKGLCQ